MFPIRDHNPSHHLPIATISLIGLTAYVFFLQLTTADPEGFIQTYSMIPGTVNFLRWETLFQFISSIFLHGGFLHIISNMWFLWIFGDNIEANLGILQYVFFYILCGVVAGLAQYFINPLSDIPTLGASGAVAGVLGAYMVRYPRHRIDTIVPMFGGFLTQIQVPASFMLMYWFVIQLFLGFGRLGMQHVG